MSAQLNTSTSARQTLRPTTPSSPDTLMCLGPKRNSTSQSNITVSFAPMVKLTRSLRKNGATVSITFANWQRNGATVVFLHGYIYT